ncbi:MAG: putative metal-binding motif-containing protein [Candidatus Lindowbacteria bacterium]|nr:putative metal-binding motif-containing protein [Candidatus Lindowbacteria bacterium]
MSPGDPEVPYNGINEDCSALTPDDDLDGDGYRIAVDCDDTDASVRPGAAEVCDDGIDNDCDGQIDSADPDCGAPPVDADGDGYASDIDCDDSDPAVNPGAAEVCDDGIDNDCDGRVDSADSDCAPQTSEMHLLRPKNHAKHDREHAPTFTWSPGSNNRFRVEFSYDPNFSTILLRTRPLDTASYTPSMMLWDRLSTDKTVYWRVKGRVTEVTPVNFQTSVEVWSFMKVNHEEDDSSIGNWPPITIIDMP